MLASELIKALQELFGEHGDAQVIFDDEAGAMYYIARPQYSSGEIILNQEK